MHVNRDAFKNYVTSRRNVPFYRKMGSVSRAEWRAMGKRMRPVVPMT
jgi:hypothetical protein